MYIHVYIIGIKWPLDMLEEQAISSMQPLHNWYGLALRGR